jgi:hypothetical protein
VLLLGLRNGGIEPRITEIGVPWTQTLWREEELDLFKGLVAGLGIGEVELNCAEAAHEAEYDEHALADVNEARRNIET